MKNTSIEFKNVAESFDGSALYHTQIISNGTEITDEILDFKYSTMCNNTSRFTFGNTASAIVEFKIHNPSIDITDTELIVKQGLKTSDDTIEYIKLGVFKVLTPERDRDMYTYKCVDKMTYLLNVKYDSQLTYPTTDIDILNEICTMAGITLTNDVLVSHTIDKKLDNYTMREMIGIIAQLQGKNAIINQDGELQLIWYAPVDYEVGDNRIYADKTSIVNSETDYVLGYIECYSGSKSIKSGDGATGVTISNPYMTQEILDEVFAKIGGFTFRSVDVDFYGDFRLEVGDIVTMVTNGETYVVPIMSLEQNSDGGVITTIESIGESDTENHTDTNGNLANQLKRSVVSADTARSIAEQSADKINFVVEGDSISEFTVTDNVIQATTEKLVIKTDKGGEVVIENGIMYVNDIFAEEITATGTITGAKLYGAYAEIEGGNIGDFNIDNGVLVGAIKDGSQVRIDNTGLLLYYGGHPYAFITTKGISLEQHENSKRYLLLDYENVAIHANKITTDTIVTGDPWYVTKEINFKISADKIEAVKGLDGTTISTLLSTDSTGKTIIPNLQVTGSTAINGATSSGSILIDTSSASWIAYSLKNSLRRVQMVIDTSGYFGFYDTTNSKWIFKSSVSGTNEFIGTLYANALFSKNTTSANTVVRISNTLRDGGLMVSDAGFLGIWDYTNSKWTIYSDASDNIFCNGALSVLGDMQTHNVIPATNATSTAGYTVGNSNFRYRYLYAASSTVQTSDRNQKNTIDYNDIDNLDKMFDDLKPCTYYMNGGDRKHMGFIAQDVEEAMNENGMTIDDLSFVCKDAEYKLIDENKPDTEENREYQFDDNGEQKHIYGLKYTELHALEVNQIQKLKTRVNDLELALSQALARIEMLEEKINK